MELTEKEFKILFDALDAWVEHGDNNQMLANLLVASMMSDKDEALSFFEGKTGGLESRKRDRADEAMLIKAKLVQLKRLNRVFVEQD